jgi:hypothetical protein
MDFYEHCDEFTGSVKDGEFLDYLSNNQLLKCESAAWGQ